jgi:uncharacterized protein YbjT (DUF2867 family)
LLGYLPQELELVVLVTGATGFIGRHLVRRLLADGHQVRILVRQPGKAAALFGGAVEMVTGDVNDSQILPVAMAGCDVLFHLANLYSMWEPDSSRFQFR